MSVQLVKGIAAAFLGAALMISIGANTARADDRATLRMASYDGHQRLNHGKRGFWRHKNQYRQRGWHRRLSYRRLSYRQWGRHCRPVSRVSHDAYGNRTVVGGTLCFNGYGRSYIVPGSRYIIQ